MYIYIYIHTYIYVYICMCLYVYIYIYVCVNLRLEALVVPELSTELGGQPLDDIVRGGFGELGLRIKGLTV